MRLSRIIRTAVPGLLSCLLFSTASAAGTGLQHERHNAFPGGHGHALDDRDYRLRQGFALGYGVAGTNTGNARYFEAPRSRTYGSTRPRLGPGGVYDRSAAPKHQRHHYHHPHGHSRYRSGRYSQGYRDGYRDGLRDSQPNQRQSVGPGR